MPNVNYFKRLYQLRRNDINSLHIMLVITLEEETITIRKIQKHWKNHTYLFIYFFISCLQLIWLNQENILQEAHRMSQFCIFVVLPLMLKYVSIMMYARYRNVQYYKIKVLSGGFNNKMASKMAVLCCTKIYAIKKDLK